MEEESKKQKIEEEEKKIEDVKKEIQSQFAFNCQKCPGAGFDT